MNIIPEINFNDLETHSENFITEVKKRGCVVIRDVFEDSMMNKMNTELEDYIEENNYYEDQKKKANIDNYFSDLKSGKPQIFGLYWSKTQVNIRQSLELDKVKKWLNHLWHFKDKDDNLIFDPNNELVYADRVRRREPGDSTLGLSPHCDAGSVERWIDKGYQSVYSKIFSDDFENYESLFWKPYVEKAIINGKHGFWRLAKVYERTETAYEGITHFFFNRPVEGGSIADELPTDSFKFQKLQEGLSAASQHSDAIILELVSSHN